MQTAKLHMTASGAEESNFLGTHSDQLNRTNEKRRQIIPDIAAAPRKLRYTPEDQDWPHKSTPNPPPRTGPPRRSTRIAPPEKPVDQDKVYAQKYSFRCQSHPVV